MNTCLVVYSIVLLFVICAVVDAGDKTTKKLFKKFYLQEKRTYSREEYNKRYRLFEQNVRFVKGANSNKEGSAHYTLNFFADKTPEEMSHYNGIDRNVNVTISDDGEDFYIKKLPNKKMWLDGVTPAKFQGDCGSCWAFSATAVLEGRYYEMSDVLRAFSVQEYIDCADAGGCDSGSMLQALQYSKTQDRLAAWSSYPYIASQGVCKRWTTANAIIAVEIMAVAAEPSSKTKTIQRLQEGVIGVDFETTDYFKFYDHGIYDGRGCTGRTINHQLAVVGYTPEYILVKNSWGERWGEMGFAKIERGSAARRCGLYSTNFFPLLQKRRNPSPDPYPSDEATSYDPDNYVPPTDNYFDNRK